MKTKVYILISNSETEFVMPSIRLTGAEIHPASDATSPHANRSPPGL